MSWSREMDFQSRMYSNSIIFPKDRATSALWREQSELTRISSHKRDLIKDIYSPAKTKFRLKFAPLERTVSWIY